METYDPVDEPRRNNQLQTRAGKEAIEGHHDLDGETAYHKEAQAIPKMKNSSQELKTARDSQKDSCVKCKATKGFSICIRGSWIDGEWSGASIHLFCSRAKPANQFITANCKGCGECARLTMRFAEELLTIANSTAADVDAAAATYATADAYTAAGAALDAAAAANAAAARAAAAADAARSANNKR